MNMIRLKDLLKEAPKKDMRVGLDYLQSIQSDEPFDTTQDLYHLALRSRLDDIMKKGLIPSMPAASTHSGALKGENFKGVWLAQLGDAEWIVDVHMLPQRYAYEGVVLKIDGSKLKKDLFNIGIELTPSLMRRVKDGETISRNEYFQASGEIVYLGNIPPKAISIYD
jgi:hypothetical protein